MHYPLVLVHDVGTNGDKCILSDQRGKILASSNVDYGVEFPRPNWAEQQPQTWWNAMCKTTKSVLRKTRISPDDIAAVSFTAQAAGTVPVDKNCVPLRPCMIWLDSRSEREAQLILGKIGMNSVYKITGGVVTGKDVVAKIMWLKIHESRIFSRAYKILDVKDYVVARLTGQFATDYSSASYTTLLDIRKKKWSDLLTTTLDLPADKLPNLVPSTARIGEVTAKAAKELGIAQGTAVIAGGVDVVLASIGAGAVDVGDCHLSLGTSAEVGINMNRVILDAHKRWIVLCHADPSQWMICGAMDCAGASLKWFLERLGPPEIGPSKKERSFALLDRLANQARVGSENLLFLPYLAGERSPIMDANAKGAFLGLTTRHRKMEIARAVLEGVALNLAWILNTIVEGGTNVKVISAVGGGSKSDLWLQMISDATNRPIHRISSPREACARGAALTGAVGSKLVKSFHEVKHVIRIDKSFKPTTINVPKYHVMLSTFIKAYEKLADVFEDLAR